MFTTESELIFGNMKNFFFKIQKMQSSVIVMNSGGHIISSRNDKNKGVKSTASSPLKFSIFLYYSKISNYYGELDWKEFFERMSKGNFLKGIKFDGTRISCKVMQQTVYFEVLCSGNMNLETDLETDTYYYNECKNFILTNSVHFSKKEEIVNREMVALPPFLMNPEDLPAGTFETSISKQRIFITEFANRKCKQFGLPKSTVEYLISSIFMNLSDKSITTKNFKVNVYGIIQSIDYLTIDSSGYRFNLPPPKKTKTREVSEDLTTEVAAKITPFKCSKYLERIHCWED